MIVVLVPKASPASVFEATREQIALTVKDTSATGSYVASIPPGLAVGEFEGAWMAMTRDMVFARYFECNRPGCTTLIYDSAESP